MYMIISNENKYLFISVPKTGTHSMYELLQEKFDGVRHGGYHHPDVPSAADDYFKFCTVRNPYAKIASAWTYISSPQGKYYSQVKTKVGDVNLVSLLKWCISNQDELLSHWDKDFTICGVILPFHMYHAQRMRGIKLDAMIQIEHATEQFNQLPFVTEHTVVPTVHTARNNPGYTEWHKINTPEVIELVNELYGPDFEMLGYDKV
jgi:hypothetical protein